MTIREAQPAWGRLFRTACSLIRQVNAADVVVDRWTFGGGTALMVQIEHRESRDVDIFLRDPQFLPLLDPSKRDFAFEQRPADCRGDGAKFLKMAFEGAGEIDFIVAPPLTSEPSMPATILGEAVLIDTIPEIITKKIFHRGAALTPRDIFDIAAAAKAHRDPVVNELRRYRNEVAAALAAVDRVNPDFVAGAITQLALRPGYASLAATARERARELLLSV